MRKDSKFKNNTALYIAGGVGILAIIVIGLLMYSHKIKENVKDETMSLEKMTTVIGENNNSTEKNNTETESASTELGKTVEESKNEINEKNNTVNNTTNTNNTSNKVNKNTKSKNITNNTNVNSSTSAKSTTTVPKEEKNAEQKQTLAFQKPVEGDIMQEYAQENLVYSKTLEEWTTHNGIDIKADKTTVVKAAEAGTVKSIKNDPRYGLTIVIEHDSTYQTVYSNLLTSEFVVEGEKVEKGQSIGTVGNSAVFEVADEPHLHFEILKNSIQVDPNIYLK
ncbi:MAG: peptidoglycan DD-metalloendopeptidase family protein [Clostridia bacterium]